MKKTLLLPLFALLLFGALVGVFGDGFGGAGPTLPSAVPLANKRGNSNIYALAANNTAAALGTLLCDDGNGNLTATSCGGSPNASPPPLFVQTSTVSLASTAVDTTMIGTGVGSSILPANFFSPGKLLRIHVAYVITNNGVAAVTYKVKLGGTLITGTQTTGAIGNPTGVCIFDVSFTGITAGTSGTIQGNGANIFCGASNMSPGQSAALTTINTTIPLQFEFDVNQSSSSNAITSTQAILSGY